MGEHIYILLIVVLLPCMLVKLCFADKTYHVAMLYDEPVLADPLGRVIVYTPPLASSTKPSIVIENCTLDDGTISAQTHEYTIPDSCSGVIPQAVGISPSALKVTADNDAVVHLMQGADADSTDGYLAIADEYLGDEYYISTYCEFGQMCQFAITPTLDDTSIWIHFPDEVNLNTTCQQTGDAGTKGGVAIPFTLNEFDVIHFESLSDLTGIHVTSDKPIAVFIGSRTPGDVTGRTIEQILPVSKWSTRFIAVPNQLNPAGDLIKIVTMANNTKVYITGFSTFNIPKEGSSVVRRIDFNSYIKTNYPVMVIQILGIDIYNTSMNESSSKPAVMLVSSIDHWTTGVRQFPCQPDTSSTPQKYSVVLAAGTDPTGIQLPAPNEKKTIEGTGSETFWGGYATFAASGTFELTADNVDSSSYGVCNSKAAFLLDADWTTNSTYTGCEPSTPIPGDRVDNDCNGLIDEETSCTESQFSHVYEVYSENNAPASLSISGVSTIPFMLKMCGSIATLQLLTDDDPPRSTTIQITNDTFTSSCNPECNSNTYVNGLGLECDVDYSFTLTITHISTITTHQIECDDCGGSGLDQTWDTQQTTNVYTDLMMTSFANSTTFNIELVLTDCAKIYSGRPDNFGKKFIVPSRDGITYKLYVVAQGPGGVKMTKPDSSQLDSSVNLGSQTFASFTGSGDQAHILESTTEISVYLQADDDVNIQGFQLIPTDVLGPEYHIYTENNNTQDLTDICKIYLLDADDFTSSARYTADETRRFVEASQPIGVFCGTNGAQKVQMPPKETLGKNFYIPAIDFPVGSIDIDIKLITTEDSDVTIIQGDYHNMDTFTFTGSFFERELVINTTYQIESSKPIMVLLEMAGSTWNSVVEIPPTEQYTNSQSKINIDAAENTKSFGITDVGGIPTETDIQTHFFNTTEPSFYLTFVEITSNQSMVIPGARLYKDINMMCSMSVETGNDGIDNDCDGLIDEDTCTVGVPGDVDRDIDGNLYEDCDDGAAPAVDLTIAFPEPFVIIDCEANVTSGTTPTEPTTFTTLFTSTTQTVTQSTTPMNTPTSPSGTPPTYSTVTHMTGAIPSSSASSTTTDTQSKVASSTTTTPAPECYEPCECPCGWVAPPQNYTQEEIEVIVEEIQEKLKLTKTELSATKRKKISAPDSRTSAIAVGYVGVVFLVVTIGSIVLLDVTSLGRDLKLMMNNLHQVFNP